MALSQRIKHESETEDEAVYHSPAASPSALRPKRQAPAPERAAEQPKKKRKKRRAAEAPQREQPVAPLPPPPPPPPRPAQRPSNGLPAPSGLPRTVRVDMVILPSPPSRTPKRGKKVPDAALAGGRAGAGSSRARSVQLGVAAAAAAADRATAAAARAAAPPAPAPSRPAAPPARPPAAAPAAVEPSRPRAAAAPAPSRLRAAAAAAAAAVVPSRPTRVAAAPAPADGRPAEPAAPAAAAPAAAAAAAAAGPAAAPAPAPAAPRGRAAAAPAAPRERRRSSSKRERKTLTRRSKKAAVMGVLADVELRRAEAGAASAAAAAAAAAAGPGAQQQQQPQQQPQPPAVAAAAAGAAAPAPAAGEPAAPPADPAATANLGKAWSKADIACLARLVEDRQFLVQTIPAHPPGAELDWELMSRHFGRYSRGGAACKSQYKAVAQIMKEARHEGKKGTSYVDLVKQALGRLPDSRGTVLEVQAVLKRDFSRFLDTYRVNGNLRWKTAVREVLEDQPALFVRVGKTATNKHVWRLV